MAQNSISTLAVHLVTDTSGMVKGFQIAQAQTQTFAANVERSNARVSRFGKITGDAAKELSKLGGAGGLAFKFAGLAGPLGLAATAITGVAVAMGRAAQASEDFQIERLRELGRLSPDILTTKEAMASANEELGRLNQTLFRTLGLTDLRKRFNTDLAGAFRNIGETFFPKTFAEVGAARDLAKDESLLALKRKADELAKAVRTPLEIFGDTVGELIRMREEGFITSELLSKGAEKAAAEYRKLGEAAGRARRETFGVSAVEAGTAAFRTFALGATAPRAGAGAPSAVEREIAATLKRIEAIDKDISKKPPITFKRGEL